MNGNRLQKTIARRRSVTGRGIHSGEICRVGIVPRPENAGISFRRLDLGQDIPCSPENIANLRRCVGLGCGPATVNTVEHLLAGLLMTGITNIQVETDGEELPILDGGSFAWVKLIRSAGIAAQSLSLKPLGPLEPLTVRDGEDFITAVPSERTLITCITDFDHPMLKRKFFSLDPDRDDPVRLIARARTFGFEKEIKSLQENGLGLGGTLENTLIFSGTGILNRNQRCPDEAVRHKILDFLGDFYLSGRPPIGHFLLFRNGHRLDVEFLKALLDREKKNRIGFQ